MSKQNAKESASTAKVVVAGFTREQMIAITRERAKRIKEHPDFATHPELQQSTAGWEAAADQLETLSSQIGNTKMELTSLLAQYGVQVAGWKRSAKKVATSVDEIAKGSAAAIKSWGFGVNSRTIQAETTAAPTGLRASYEADFSLVARWDAVRGNRGFLVQIGDQNGQSWGAPTPSPKASFVPLGLSPGQKIAMRVAVQRKNGVSAWSDHIVMTAH